MVLDQKTVQCRVSEQIIPLRKWLEYAERELISPAFLDEVIECMIDDDCTLQEKKFLQTLRKDAQAKVQPEHEVDSVDVSNFPELPTDERQNRAATE
jgi:hypothetical protein